MRIENPEATAHTRIGWLRAVNNIQHAFAAQSFIAEIAQAQGKDHREYLLELLGSDRLIDPRKISEPWNHGESPERYPINTGRLRKVIERVTKEADWGRKLPSRQGLGLAAHYSFVTYMAAVIEVAVSPTGELVIPRVDIAVDCGPHVNPDRVRSQLEGACVMGLSQAIVERDHVQEWSGAAGQLPPVRDRPDERRAEEDRRPHHAVGLVRHAARRRRRARGAGDRAGLDERDRMRRPESGFDACRCATSYRRQSDR